MNEQHNSLITAIPPRKSYPCYIDPHKTIVRLTRERDLLALSLRKLLIDIDATNDHPVLQLLDSIYED